jgi:hypothetical protein
VRWVIIDILNRIRLRIKPDALANRSQERGWETAESGPLRARKDPVQDITYVGFIKEELAAIFRDLLETNVKSRRRLCVILAEGLLFFQVVKKSNPSVSNPPHFNSEDGAACSSDTLGQNKKTTQHNSDTSTLSIHYVTCH